MKKLIFIPLIIFCWLFQIEFSIAQNDPILSIDGINTMFKTGLSLPYWLKQGQTIDLVSNVKSASILEFTLDSNNLKFSRVISLNTFQTVPNNKVWKIEGLGLGLSGLATSGFSTSNSPTIFVSPKTFDIPGTYSWIVPPGITNICIEVWGGGGKGGSVAGGGAGGGGGGGYGYQCFPVIPGTVYSIIVGGGRTASSFGNLITATAGQDGTAAGGGNGGNSTATFNISGTKGGNASYPLGAIGGAGGNGGAGGSAGATNSWGGDGTSPGGGGGSDGSNASPTRGGAGANGKVIVYW